MREKTLGSAKRDRKRRSELAARLTLAAFLFCIPHTAFAQTWARTYGGAAYDGFFEVNIQQTTDGGFVVAETTDSFGTDHVWVLKLDASGNVTWQKTYGGSLWEYAYSIQQTMDGGFVVAGAGNNDFWVLKLDASGNISWQKTYGGFSSDEAHSIQQTTDGGFVVAGTTGSLPDKDIWVLKLDASGAVQWQKTYGGASYDWAWSIQQTADGGFVVAGQTNSFGAGNPNSWLLKLDASGNVQWQKTYGGADDDYAYSIQQTTDGGFVVAGRTNSFGAGSTDFWILKLDASGNIQWQKTYGGVWSDSAFSIQQTTDGSYVVAGWTGSFGAGGSDFWVLKLGASGNVSWQKTYGGASNDYAYSIQQTTDGGFVVAGITDSFGAGSSDFWVLKMDANGEIDASCTFISDTSVTGVNSSATVTTTGVSGVDSAATITVTSVTGVDSAATEAEQCYGCTDDAYEPDNGCIASKTVIHDAETQTHNFCYDTEDFLSFNACAGQIYTIDAFPIGASIDVALDLYSVDCAGLLDSDYVGPGFPASINWTAPADGTYHICAYQFDATTGKDRGYDITLTGDTSSCALWARTYGGALADYAYSIQQTMDGGFAVGGITSSFGAGGAWVLKLDVSGNVLWQKVYEGGSVNSIQQTTDGGYVVLGMTNAFGAGSYDFWVLKLDASGNVTWQKTYGGVSHEYAYSIQQATDGGYVVAGRAYSFAPGSDAWVLKLDASGNVTWQKTYGGGNWEELDSIKQTSDGGYIVAGYTLSFGAGGDDFWVLKLDASGDVLWQKAYGGSNNDHANSIQQTTDGGYIVAGYTDSFGAGGSDLWVLKLDASGNVAWQKAYGGFTADQALSTQQTADGGYVVTGRTYSFGAGGADSWVLKLDASGNITWQKAYGGASNDHARSIQQTSDGDYVVAGYTDSFGAGSYDFWVLKMDANGNIDPSCTFIAGTAATVTDTTATITYTTVSGADTAATVTVTTVTPADSAAVINEQCASACLALDPAVIQSISPNPACDGDTVTFTAQAATGGVSPYVYRWDFTDDGTFDATAQTAANVYAAGGYTVRLRVEDSCGAGVQTQETTDTLTVNALPTPTITPDGPTTFCDGGSVTLDADAWSGYSWSTGATTQTINVTASGSYTVTVTDANGCSGTSAPEVVTVDCPTWARTYGGTSNDDGYSIQQTTGGGYVVAGLTDSFGAGSADFWVLKLDASGNVQWQKTYGGGSEDIAYSIQQTTDGSFVVAGYTTSFGAGGNDSWVLKLDTAGNVQWQKTYGGASGEVASSIQQTSDGGFVVAGSTVSFGAGGADFWVLKLDALGNVLWQKTYGGAGFDYGRSIQQTLDGGFVVAGPVNSFGVGVNFWVLKLDASGNVQWQKAYGGNNPFKLDLANSVQQTSDGGFIVAGITGSFGAGFNDFWVLKLDALGNVLWQKTYGGANLDQANSIQQTTDGGFVVAGRTRSFGVDGDDFWLLKLNASGNVEWQKAYGSALDDWAFSIEQTTDGGFVVAGFTDSFGNGLSDFWVLKLDANGNTDALCTLTVDTAATITDTTAMVTLTGASGIVSSATLTDTAVSGVNSPAVMGCPCELLSDTLPDAPAICAGGCVMLDANPGGGTPPYTFLWNTGATSQTINVCPVVTTVYDVTVTDSNGCSAPLESETVTVDPLPTPVITETCGNPSSTLDAGAGYGFYLWSMGAKSQTISVPCGTGTDYTVTVLDGNGCIGTSAPPYTVCDCSGPLDELDIRVADLAGGSWLILVHQAAATQYNVYANPLSTFGAAGDEYGSPDGAVLPSACNVGFTPSGGTATVDYPGDFPDNSWIVVTAATASAGSESTPGYDSAATERNTVGAWTMCGP